ncbi:MAG TPA: GntR family transcriptional regulator [Firmicutes bacterium]|nr:GntR family transcriptional regulator [Bacillota bacterium]
MEVPQICLSKRSGTPIYLQISSEVKRLIETEVWPKGHRLPTERELAKALGVSRNTVSQAYRELEAEGIITSRQGRGTFVASGGSALVRSTKRERLLRMIDLSLEEAMDLGFSLDEFAAMVQSRCREKKEVFRHMRVGFVECNREQLDSFSRQIQLGAGVTIQPLLLDDLRNGLSVDCIKTMDLIVTTFFHLNEVRSLTANWAHVIAIALNPEPQTLVRIARLKRGSKVGLICITEAFARGVVASIREAGILDLEFRFSTARGDKDLRGVLQEVSAVIVSPGRRKQVERLIPAGMELIEFEYVPDPVSISLLKSVILEKKPWFRQEEVS